MPARTAEAAWQGNTEATIPGITAEEFEQASQGAKAGCPVSKILAGSEIHLTATLQ